MDTVARQQQRVWKMLSRPTKGFTLVEILVALVVMAFGLGALWIGLNQAINVNSKLPDQMVARWIAQNRLVMRQARSEWPPTREFKGTEKMNHQEWYWTEKIESTDEPLMRRIVVEVRKNGRYGSNFYHGGLHHTTETSTTDEIQLACQIMIDSLRC